MTAFTRNGVKHAYIRYFGLFILFCLMFSSLVAQEHAYMYIAGGAAEVAITNVDTWTTVAGFTEGSTSSGWTCASDILTASTVNAVGYYFIKYSLSFTGGEADWSVGISIDDGSPSEPFLVRYISNPDKDMGNVSGVFVTQITNGQSVRLKVKPSVAGDFMPIHAQVAVVRVSQSTTNCYGGMHNGGGTLSEYTDITAFAKLTNFSAVDERNEWDVVVSELTAGDNDAGTYYISASISFSGDGGEGNPQDYTFKLVNNNASNTINIFASRKTSDDDIGNVSAGGIITVSAGDLISLEGKCGGNNKTLTIEKATISLFKLSGTDQGAYASMINSNQSVTIDFEDTWTTVGGYTSNSPNLWELNSNEDMLSLNSTNAYGYYYLEFSASLSTANAGGDNVELGVFIDNTLESELTVRRRLSDEDDVGAVCGVGLFQVDGPGTVTLKIMNTTSTNNITIEKSMVGFSQIRYVESDTPLPISLNSFNVEQQNNAVKLNWQTASEVENLGYKIYRKENEGMFEEISSYAYNDALRGQGTTTDMHDYEFIDTDVESGKEYTYLLSDVSYHMEEVRHIDYLRTIYLPEGIKVDAAFPNPFNPQCTIPYTLDINEHVRIDLLDISGKVIRTLVSKDHIPGNYNVHINEPSLGSGVYLVRVQSGAQVEVQKIMMLK